MFYRSTNMNERDKKIRTALEDADEKGKLSVVAAVTGISGGEQRLREIMNGGELSFMDVNLL